MLRVTASGTSDSSSGYHLLFTPRASGILSQEAGNPAVCSWFSSLQADWCSGRANSPHLPWGGGRCLIMHHASDFPLEGWRQGLNSALPQISRDTGSWKASAIAPPPPCMRTQRLTARTPPPPTQTDNGCWHQFNPTQYYRSGTGMDSQEDRRGLERRCSSQNSSQGPDQACFKYSIHMPSLPLHW